MVQKCANRVDVEKCSKTFFAASASIQSRTIPPKFSNSAKICSQNLNYVAKFASTFVEGFQVSRHSISNASMDILFCSVVCASFSPKFQAAVAGMVVELEVSIKVRTSQEARKTDAKSRELVDHG